MNSPSRLLNSAMSLSSSMSMCAHAAAGDVSSSSFCMPTNTSFSPIHCYSSLAELSLSSSSLDATIPFSTAHNAATSTHHHIVSSSNTNSLLASPVARSPRGMLDSPLMNHDIFISPIRQHQLQTPTSLSEPKSHASCGRYSPIVSRVTNCSLSPISSGLLSISPSSSSSSNVTSAIARPKTTISSEQHFQMPSLLFSHSFSSTSSANNGNDNEPVTFTAPSILTSSTSSSSIAVSAHHHHQPHHNQPSTSMSTSFLSAALQQGKPRPPPPKIAPAPTPAHRMNNNRSSATNNRMSRANSFSEQQQQQHQQHQQQPSRRSNAKAAAAAARTSSSSTSTVVQSLPHSQPLLISTAVAAAPQPATVQGLLIQVPVAANVIAPTNMNTPVLLTITSPQVIGATQTLHHEHHQQQQPLLVMSSSQHQQMDMSGFAASYTTTNRPSTSSIHLHQQQQQFHHRQNNSSGSNTNYLKIASSSTQRSLMSQQHSILLQQQQQKTQQQQQPGRNLSLCDEEIPTKSINLENLTCARSLVVFPPTLPAFTTSAKHNLFNSNFMSMPGLSLLASPTGSGTQSLANSGPPSPNANLLSLSPSHDVVGAIPGAAGGGHPVPVTGLTPAQLAAQMRLSDAVHLASDTTIAGIHIGNLLEAVRRCRERRIRLGIAQQEVSNALVPQHGEMFRQASICKLENLSMKLEVASRMIKLLEPYFDMREEEFSHMAQQHHATNQPSHQSQPRLNPRSKNYQRHNQRHPFSDDARDYLRGIFVTNPYPTRKMLADIAEKLGMPRSSVRIWFSNRRIEQNKRQKLLADAGSSQAPSAPLILKPSTSSTSITSMAKRRREDGQQQQQQQQHAMISGQVAMDHHQRARISAGSDNSDLLVGLTNSQASNNTLNIFGSQMNH